MSSVCINKLFMMANCGCVILSAEAHTIMLLFTEFLADRDGFRPLTDATFA